MGKDLTQNAGVAAHPVSSHIYVLEIVPPHTVKDRNENVRGGQNETRINIRKGGVKPKLGVSLRV